MNECVCIGCAEQAFPIDREMSDSATYWHAEAPPRVTITLASPAKKRGLEEQATDSSQRKRPADSGFEGSLGDQAPTKRMRITEKIQLGALQHSAPLNVSCRSSRAEFGMLMKSLE